VAAHDDVYLFVPVLDLVVGDEQQLAGIALVRVDPERGDAEVLSDRMPAVAEVREVACGSLVPRCLLRRTDPQSRSRLLSLLPGQLRLVRRSKRARNLGDIDNDPAVALHAQMLRPANAAGVHTARLGHWQLREWQL